MSKAHVFHPVHAYTAQFDDGPVSQTNEMTLFPYDGCEAFTEETKDMGDGWVRVTRTWSEPNG